MQEQTFMVACRKFFGFLPGQGLMDFKAEIDKLTDEDREYFRREFAAIGIKITN